MTVDVKVRNSHQIAFVFVHFQLSIDFPYTNPIGDYQLQWSFWGVTFFRGGLVR